MQQVLSNRRSQILLVLLVINAIILFAVRFTTLFNRLDINHYQPQLILVIACVVFGVLTAIVGIWALIQSRRKKQVSWLLSLAVVVSGVLVILASLASVLYLVLSYSCAHDGQCL